VPGRAGGSAAGEVVEVDHDVVVGAVPATLVGLLVVEEELADLAD
jgi:hypothetical protein